MFKSIEYKLIAYLAIVMLSLIAATYLFMHERYLFGAIAAVLILYALNRILYHYGRFNKNILFLLNALDNGDYSFKFAETKMSNRERELNNMMNRIKEILARAREEVIEDERFLSLILESVSVGIVILDEGDNVIATNRVVEQMLGLPVFTHLKQLEVIDRELPQIFISIEPSDNRTINIPNEREELQIALHVSKISMKRGTMKIITLNSIGNELEIQEMESWVRLIRVMTHEIMNSVAPITSLTDTLLFSYGNKSTESRRLQENTVEALQTISSTAKGLMSFVNSYRSFTGVAQPQKSPVDIVSVIDNILALYAENLVLKNIKTEIIGRDLLPYIDADEFQITQVVTNLVKNGIEAIDGEKGGDIIIKISRMDDRISIDICNDGEPISEEILPNIFIPFFTTKDGGSGIGLSISRYIMRLHGGNLKHHFKDGWTVFSMIFSV